MEENNNAESIFDNLLKNKKTTDEKSKHIEPKHEEPKTPMTLTETISKVKI